MENPVIGANDNMKVQWWVNSCFIDISCATLVQSNRERHTSLHSLGVTSLVPALSSPSRVRFIQSAVNTTRFPAQI